jgi:hypothetical protein
MKITTVLNTAALAITLAFAGAAHASQNGDVYNTAANFSGGLVDPGAKLINPEPDFPFPAVSVSVYDMTNAADFRQTYVAFCFEPEIVKGQHATYAATYWADTTVVSNSVRALYETSYQSTIGNADKQFSFQLALWDLKSDNGDLYSGKQSFSLGGAYADARVTDAALMLDQASKVTTLNNTYLYTIFTGTNPDGSASQTLIGAAPVPEADTWAMLATGLGLVGFMGRRQSKKSQKFAA